MVIPMRKLSVGAFISREHVRFPFLVEALALMRYCVLTVCLQELLVHYKKNGCKMTVP